ncbi:MAG: hypothetical protein QNJ46_01910 [Leptolyngbyaceae cyanobacterium MO_188.B28]|nr:hypothetical protein [Leptolyngbyaceae cyanobacterium MO_188.B28]
MISVVKFALLLIYLVIGIVITISADALAIALIDEDVYGIPDNAPLSSEWELLLWKSVSVMVSPVMLAAFPGMLVFVWLRRKRHWFHLMGKIDETPLR